MALHGYTFVLYGKTSVSPLSVLSLSSGEIWERSVFCYIQNHNSFNPLEETTLSETTLESVFIECQFGFSFSLFFWH